MNHPFVVDASMAIAWVHCGQATPESDEALEAVNGGASIAAPGLWPLETSNTLIVLNRRGKLTKEELALAIQNLSKIRIELDTQFLSKTFSTIVELAKEHRLSVYDAAYLELAIRKGLPLCCRDSALAAAATAAGVQLWSAGKS